MGHSPTDLNRWPNGRIPFAVNSNVTDISLTNLNTAIAQWNAAPVPIQVVAKDASDVSWVEFKVVALSNSPCRSSHIGMGFGRQTVMCSFLSVLGPNGVLPGTWAHEIGHVVGLKHEHQRIDRDDHAVLNSIIAFGIALQKPGNYKKLSPPAFLPLGDYDCGSLMHYSTRRLGGVTYFGPKPGGDCASTSTFGSSGTLTKGDLAAVNALY